MYSLTRPSPSFTGSTPRNLGLSPMPLSIPSHSATPLSTFVPSSIYVESPHSKGRVMSGEPPPGPGHPAPGPGHPAPGTQLTGPSYVIHLWNPKGRLRNGIKSAIKPETSADHSGHVLLVSNHLYPRPSMGILRVSSLRIPLTRCVSSCI
jgi:hypothetical protein